MTKNEIRKEVLSHLKKMTDRDERSLVIKEKFLSLPQVTAAFSVALFMSMPTEPDTSGVLSELLRLGKEVYVPRVRGEEMDFVKVGEETDFISGAFGVKEPIGERYDGSFDVMAVPLVAFDESGNRLGHGKGYYDKYLKKYPCFTVGLAFVEQKKDIPVEAWDVPLNVVLYV